MCDGLSQVRAASITLADRLAELQKQAELSRHRKQHLSYRVEYFCEAFRKVPREIPLDPRHLRALEASADLKAIGISQDTWYKIIWAVNHVLLTSTRLYTGGGAFRQLAPDWRGVLDAAKPGHERTHLSVLAWFATAAELSPQAIDDNSFVTFGTEQVRISLFKDWEPDIRRTKRLWNAVGRRAPELELRQVMQKRAA